MLPEDNGSLIWAFDYFYHRDKMNACVHCSPVRFSEITFLLYNQLALLWREDADITMEMAEVKFHIENDAPIAAQIVDKGITGTPIPPEDVKVACSMTWAAKKACNAWGAPGNHGCKLSQNHLGGLHICLCGKSYDEYEGMSDFDIEASERSKHNG